MIRRRNVLTGTAAAASAGLLSAPAQVRAEKERVLRFMPQAALVVLDPGNSPGWITRNHAALIFDQLYGMDGHYQPQPQMAEGHTVENDGKLWRITLRDGLLWHDGEKVTARDCVASIRRWGKRDALGSTLMATTDELSAPDDRTIQFRLKEPFPMLAAALGKVPTFCCFMMPERLANADPFKPLNEMVGSGPYRFKPDAYLSGARSVYARFENYKPRENGTPDWTSGPKVAYFDRIEWTNVPDASMAAAALQQGGQDWWEFASLDLVELLKRDGTIKVETTDPSGGMLYMRENSLQPPFNNPGVRRALLWAISQQDCMQAIAPEPSMYHVPVGMFTPNTPMANDNAMAAITAPRDLSKARRMLEDAGYQGETVRLIAPTDYQFLHTLGDVMADVMQRIGMKVDYVVTDWGTLLQRRTNSGTIEQGGWSAIISGSGGTDWLNPVFNSNLRAGGNTPGTQPGWPNIPQLEQLRSAWLRTGDLSEQQRLCREIQAVAIDQLPVYPLGQYFQPTAYRTDITGVLRGFATFWNVRRTG